MFFSPVQNVAEPDPGSVTFESFERTTPLDYYSENFDAFTTQQSTVFDGSYALEGQSSSSTTQNVSVRGVDYYPVPGDTFRLSFDYDQAGDNIGVWFAVQPGSFETWPPNGYLVRLNGGSDALEMYKYNSGFTLLDSASVTTGNYTNSEVEFEISWDSTSGAKTVNFIDGGSSVATVSDTASPDTTFSEGGIGHRVTENGGNTTITGHWDHWRLTDWEGWMWDRTNINRGREPDGMAVADFDFNGDIDVAVSTGGNGAAYWYENGGNGLSWTEHTITTGQSRIEWVDAADIDGDGVMEVTLTDRSDGELLIAKPDTNDPTGSWSVTQLDGNAPGCRDHFIFDVDGDGDKDIIYAFPGSSAGVGGVYWQEYSGGDPLDASNWSRNEMVQVDGAALGAFETKDISGNGSATDVMAGTRPAWNSNATRELYWLEKPNDPTNTWTKTTIDTSHYFSNGGFGNLFDNGHSKDYVVGAAEDGDTGLFRFDYSNSWSRTEITSVADHGWYGVRAWSLNPSSTRDQIVGGDNAVNDLLLLDHDGSEFIEQLRRTKYGKNGPLPVQTFDINGDGYDEIVTSANLENSIDWWDVYAP